jgi:hypothetical protein
MIDVKTGEVRTAKEICGPGLVAIEKACEKLMGRLIGGRNASSVAKPNEAPKGDLYVIIRDDAGKLHYLINGEKQTKAFDVTADIGQSIYTSGKNVYKSKGRKILRNGQKIFDLPISLALPYKIHAILVSGEDIYTVGYTTFHGGGIAGHVWKNDAIYQIHYGPEGTFSLGFSMCNSIFISDDDLYVGGLTGKNPVIWKNNVLFRSFDKSEYQCSIPLTIFSPPTGVVSAFIK